MRFSALGDSAIIAECGNDRSPETLQRVRAFAEAIERAHVASVLDVVPAFASVTVFYDPSRIASTTNELPYTWIAAELARLASDLKLESSAVRHHPSKEVVIPVCYGGEAGPDLASLAQEAGLTVEEAIALHSGASYLVHAIGFSPGFPYLGGLPEKLHAARLPTPRTTVPAGSVGIGGAQTGIYPLATPGGWQIIGRTPLKLFDVTQPDPALLRLGDRVKFQAVEPKDFPTCSMATSPAAVHAGVDAGGSAKTVKVVRAGMLTTVQDLGRPGHRAAGVPLGGAADAMALRVVNWLVGNSESAPALEFTLVGPELEFVTDTLIALGGADFGPIARWQPAHVAAGTRLRLGPVREGCRGYLAVAGGFEIPRVLGSASTELRAGFGGIAGRTLRDGDVLRIGPGARRLTDHWRIDPRILPAYSPAPVVRVVAGPHAQEFSPQWLSDDFAVTPRSDRMGLRLSGPEVRREATGEKLSMGVTPGTIQVPADGQPIVLLADAQTIGGYPQLAQVITVDLPLVAQLKPGDRVRFRMVSLEEAQRLLLAREHALAILREGLAQKFD
jgi:KipI family sensor histidine kinase inhibitor